MTLDSETGPCSEGAPFTCVYFWPLTNCEAERTFSGLRRLKAYTRSTMREDWLNGLVLMMVHRSISISVGETIDKFAAQHTRKMRFAFILNDP